jgi:hypothetical protein
MNRAFGAGEFWLIETLGRCPRLQMNDAPLALTNNQAKCPIPTGKRPIFSFGALSAKGASHPSLGHRPRTMMAWRTSAEDAIQRMVVVDPIPIDVRMNRAFGAGELWLIKFLGRCPRLRMNDAPLALIENTQECLCSGASILRRD